MEILSLFDGISACQQAFKNLGIKFDGINNKYFASEIDKHAIKTTQYNFPNTIQLGDVKKIGYDFNHILIEGKPEEAYCAKIDLLVAGFPCQDLSSAKKDNKGLKGSRSGLFYELLRIIKEVKPKHILIENVASMKAKWKQIISEELGFDFTEINSALVTAQNRRRCYWVASLQEDGSYKKVDIVQPQDKGILLKDVLENGVSFNEKSYCIDASYYKGSNLENTLKKHKRTMIAEPIQTTEGEFNIIATQLGQSKKWGNAINLKGKAFTLRASQPNGVIINAKARKLTVNESNQGNIIYSVEKKSINFSINQENNDAKTELYKIDLPDGDYSVRKLTVNECCRLQGFPDNYVASISKSQGYKALGNSFTVPIIEHILKHLF